jgi:hypothetical protein
MDIEVDLVMTADDDVADAQRRGTTLPCPRDVALVLSRIEPARLPLPRSGR